MNYSFRFLIAIKSIWSVRESKGVDEDRACGRFIVYVSTTLDTWFRTNLRGNLSSIYTIFTQGYLLRDSRIVLQYRFRVGLNWVETIKDWTPDSTVVYTTIFMSYKYRIKNTYIFSNFECFKRKTELITDSRPIRIKLITELIPCLIIFIEQGSEIIEKFDILEIFWKLVA